MSDKFQHLGLAGLMNVSNSRTHSFKCQNLKFQNISFAQYQMLNQQNLNDQKMINKSHHPLY